MHILDVSVCIKTGKIVASYSVYKEVQLDWLPSRYITTKFSFGKTTPVSYHGITFDSKPFLTQNGFISHVRVSRDRGSPKRI